MFLSIIAVTVLGIAAGTWLCYVCLAPSSTFFGPVLIRGTANYRQIALTFDDGPAPPSTDRILDILRDKKVPATFFVCGSNVKRHPETARRIAQEGHELGNHTFFHPSLFLRGSRRITQEIDLTQEAIENAAGVRPTVFRPPYGVRSFGLMKTLEARGLNLVMWSASGYDWKLNEEGIARSVLQNINPGAVILLHDGRGVETLEPFDCSHTQKALPRIIDQAREAGFEFVPLSKFLGH